ncbi:MAG: hypothetical protein KIS83_08855 [Rubrivivax sp.]|nr:hypothetical protein [Rubrivivax sp.]
MNRTAYALLGLALMVMVAFAPLLGGGGTPVAEAPAPQPPATPDATASAVDRAVEDLAAWPVAATR